MHGVEACDDIWHTCCALHNWLLEHDGLDKEWGTGVSSEWEGQIGEFNEEMVERYSPPDAILLLHNPAARGSYDSSGMGAADTDQVEFGGEYISESRRSKLHKRMQNQNSIRIVKDLPLDYFRDRLVEHFHILWTRNEVVWPARNAAHVSLIL